MNRLKYSRIGCIVRKEVPSDLHAIGPAPTSRAMSSIFSTRLHAQRFDFFNAAVDIDIDVRSVEQSPTHFRICATIHPGTEDGRKLVFDRVFEHDLIDTRSAAAQVALQHLFQHFTIEGTGSGQSKAVLCMKW